MGRYPPELFRGTRQKERREKFIGSLDGFFSSFFLIRLQMTALIFPSAAAPADIVATQGNQGLFFIFYITEEAIQYLHTNLLISNPGYSLRKYKKPPTP